MRRHVGNDLIEVLAIVVFTISLQVWQTNSQGSQGISAQDQFDLMVNNTKSIASKLSEIYSSSCPQDCNCSQDLCQPLANGTFTCFPHRSIRKDSISDPGLYYCSSKLREKLGPNENVCSSIYVTQNKSSVTYPRGADSPPRPAQISAICSTQELDKLFSTLSASVRYYAEYYVGMVDGSRRTFPGREESGESCHLYDSRKRPWYNGAIYYPNHLVILIDTGRTMNNTPITGDPHTTRLMISQEYASSLMETAYTSGQLESYINVFSFGGTNSLYNKPTTVEFHPEDPESHPELINLTSQINTLKVDDARTTLDDFLVALNLTLRAFNELASETNAQKPPLQRNIILFTDGSFTSSLNPSSVTDVRNRLISQGVNLFIYGIDASGNDAGLISFSDNVNGFSGIYQNLTSSNLRAHDPLFYMRSYFGFLAASHTAWYSDTPIWSQEYKDYFNVGNITTVSMPVFNEQNLFVGVAAIDIILEELGADGTPLKDNFINIVKTNQRIEPNGSSTAQIPATFNDSSCGEWPNLLCETGNDSGTSCCNICGVSNSNNSNPTSNNSTVTTVTVPKSNKPKLEMILGPAIGGSILLVILAAASTYFLRRRPNRAPPVHAHIAEDRNGEDRWTRPV